jgi:hypothetical protein
MMDSIPPYPLFNSFYTFRASPLFHGKLPLLHKATLSAHARRMRDRLKGDVLRGVQISNQPVDASLLSLGPLEECRWDLLGDEEAWRQAHIVPEQDEENDELSQIDLNSLEPQHVRGIHIQLKYRRTTHTALLLREPEPTKPSVQFTSLPLLLLRMPQALRELVISHLSSTFDTRISPMHLYPSFLTASVESLLSRLSAKDSRQSVPEIVGQLKVQLSFCQLSQLGPQYANALRHTDITIEKDDIQGFLTKGKLLSNQIYNDSRHPFTASLIHYLSAHLAFEPNALLNSISRIDCIPLLMSKEGKVRFAAPRPYSLESSSSHDEVDESPLELFTQDLYLRLVREAAHSNASQISLRGLTQMEDAMDLDTRSVTDTMKATQVEAGNQMRKERMRKRKVVEDENISSHEQEASHVAQRVGSEVVFDDPPPPYAP